MSKKQESEVTPVTPKMEAPLTKAYLFEKLKSLGKSIDEARWHSEDLSNKIEKLRNERSCYDGPLARDLEERNHLLRLYNELGGNEWEITG